MPSLSLADIEVRTLWWTNNDITGIDLQGVFTASVGTFHLERCLKTCKLKFEGSFQVKPFDFTNLFRGSSVSYFESGRKCRKWCEPTCRKLWVNVVVVVKLTAGQRLRLEGNSNSPELKLFMAPNFYDSRHLPQRFLASNNIIWTKFLIGAPLGPIGCGCTTQILVPQTFKLA